MPTVLNANFVYANIENGVVMIGFADDEFETNEYILLQKTLQCNEQDKILGHDKVNISYMDQLKSAYGGINKVVLKDLNLFISLDQSTAHIISSEQEIYINMALDNIAQLESLKDNLKLMFKTESHILFLQ